MRTQLKHLVEASRLPNVKLQVVPFLAGSHRLESEADTARHNTKFERIARNGLALHDSVELIERIRKEL
jgi:hypothetical protein